jgi:hypothetical protein
MVRAFPWIRTAIVATLFVIACTALRAQGGTLTATGDQGLQFGVVLPGLASPVSPTDAAMAGRFEIRGDRESEVVIDFILPTEMLAPGGAMLPLVFGVDDGRWGTRPSINQSQTFDPSVPLVARLGRSGRLYLRLGGTAMPLPSQVPGDYSATIAVTVAYTGN